MDTGLVCARCERPVCGYCVVATTVGTRCRDCAPDTGRRAGPGTSGVFELPRMPGRLALRILAALGAIGIAVVATGYAYLEGDRDRLIVRAVVFGGALFSMVLHEYCHGLVAYFGGDRTVKDRGFLTFNPAKFMDPVYSVAMPMLFVLMGGLPLIGGRTLIDSSRLRSPWWRTGVSLAGPGANLLLAVVLATVLRLGIVDPYTPLGAGMAYLAVLQIGCAMFNLIPVPPLDGFGAIAPHLSFETQTKAYSMGYFGYFALLTLMWTVPGTGAALWDQAYSVAWALHVPEFPAYIGEYLARLR